MSNRKSLPKRHKENKRVGNKRKNKTFTDVMEDRNYLM